MEDQTDEQEVRTESKLKPFDRDKLYDWKWCHKMSLHSNEIEAANRAEATSLLIRLGYRVYRPEADVSGEDLVIRTPQGELASVQLQSRPAVDWEKYGKHAIWLLFPDPNGNKLGRDWFLIEHNKLYEWWKERHGTAACWDDGWSVRGLTVELRKFLEDFALRPKKDYWVPKSSPLG